MGDEKSSHAFPPLSTLWCMRDPRGKICHSCHRTINSGALIRTFRVESADYASEEGPGTEIFAALGRKMVLLYRHFECLRSCGARYISVSHVWDRLVSILQNRGAEDVEHSSPEALKASELAFTEAINVYEGISKSLHVPFEAWQDYVSVPQWERDVKTDILLKIPDIFNHSFFTAVYWHDVEPLAIQQIHESEGTSSSVHLSAITHICNCRWFRRVWTAMEYIRSQRVRVMLKGYRLCDDGDDLFSHKVEHLWHEEGLRVGDIYELEHQAGLNRNLLPWQVGGLGTLRQQSQARNFGIAFERLALRGCTNPLDFYYAMLGLVGFEEHLQSDPRAARWQIIRRCLENQDYSPILMVPHGAYLGDRFFQGFADMKAWGLGPTVSKAKLHLSTRGTKAVFHAQSTGKISFLESSLFVPLGRDPVPIFTQPARIVLDFVGPDVEKFVIALGLRIFGINPYAVLQRLVRIERYDSFRNTLSILRTRSTPWPKDLVLQMIDDLGLRGMDLDPDQKLEDRRRQPSFWRQQTEGIARWNPMAEFMLYSTGIHLEERSAFVGMDCPGCSQVVLVRAAIYKQHSEVHDAIGFRIPGLQYERTLPDGAGILVKDENIVGRFIYCCPCCPGPPTQEIQVELPDIPMPSPNPILYGEIDG